jgi:hypothetical protein
MKRIFFSALAAVPSTLFSFGLADSTKTPYFIRYLIAPGVALSWNVHLSFEHGMDLALLADGAYYTVVIYLISSLIDAHNRSRSLRDNCPTKS